ncbi:MAG TPA: hypothetical protein VNE58_00995 [Casimicrobiaceae bacterium]|nr:hypothetical protein [Casimicrobiaceae bacterium]
MPPRSRKAPPSADPTPEQEAAAYLRGLQHHGRVAQTDADGKLPPGVTHVVEVRKGGAKRVKRRRFD